MDRTVSTESDAFQTPQRQLKKLRCFALFASLRFKPAMCDGSAPLRLCASALRTYLPGPHDQRVEDSHPGPGSLCVSVPLWFNLR